MTALFTGGFYRTGVDGLSVTETHFGILVETGLQRVDELFRRAQVLPVRHAVVATVVK